MIFKCETCGNRFWKKSNLKDGKCKNCRDKFDKYSGKYTTDTLDYVTSCNSMWIVNHETGTNVRHCSECECLPENDCNSSHVNNSHDSGHSSYDGGSSD